MGWDRFSGQLNYSFNMTQERKQKEIEYYDYYAERMLKSFPEEGKRVGDFEGFKPLILDSFKFCYKLLEENCFGKRLLDYGCGNGIHSIFPAKNGAEVVGIDLSEMSLEVAKERAGQAGLKERIKFLKMDCETMKFSDNFFDIVFDGGTFSSLDLNKAFPEISRVLRPEGFLIGIETLGHNPLTNLKRRINRIFKKRTEWAATHILKLEDFKLAERYFEKIEVYYFHLVSWIAFPFLGLPGSQILLKLLEAVDDILLRFSPLRRYAFKVVFMLSNPKKPDAEKSV